MRRDRGIIACTPRLDQQVSQINEPREITASFASLRSANLMMPRLPVNRRLRTELPHAVGAGSGRAPTKPLTGSEDAGTLAGTSRPIVIFTIRGRKERGRSTKVRLDASRARWQVRHGWFSGVRRHPGGSGPNQALIHAYDA